ncbi:MAG: hypothetical protein KAS13_06745 [Candidatus Omnitrophica bacterium]|nr:hypothetical protein [Candidatus Omnitrophota bacterium]
MKTVKYKIKLIVKSITFIIVVFFLTLWVGINCLLALESNKKEISTHSYVSSEWNKAINQEENKNKKYPDKKKITPETVRLTINEYYIPQFSELLDKGVEYFEWLNKLDDPYLNRYKLDVRVDPDDERLKLFWKRSF